METGSSAMMIFGCSIRARATMMRCRWPPFERASPYSLIGVVPELNGVWSTSAFPWDRRRRIADQPSS